MRVIVLQQYNMDTLKVQIVPCLVRNKPHGVKHSLVPGEVDSFFQNDETHSQRGLQRLLS